MKTARILLTTIAAIALASCSGSKVAKTRKEKEQEFKNAFGFSPPSTIVSIEYADLYNRGVTDGAYGQWISFTYDSTTYGKILSSGYKPTGSDSLPTGDASPTWWPKSVAGALFTRDQNDTPAVEGFSFREFLWHDTSAGLVYFHKSYWD